jgi:hypothetical protein
MTRHAMLAVLMLSLGCATRSAVPRDRSQSAVDERLAAQRRNDPHLRAEENEHRFGFERAKQRKRPRKPPAATAPAAAQPADVTKSKDGKTPPQ